MNVEKPGFRVLGIAESFGPGSAYSKMVGVVMRADLVIDGIAQARIRLDSDDVAEKIVGMYRKLGRNDVNAIMIAGAIVSKYNIIDVEKIHSSLKKPVICITYKSSRGITGAIRHHFRDDPNTAKRKVEEYRKLGPRVRAKLSTGQAVYLRVAGMPQDMAKIVVERFVLQGGIPEPNRVAKLFARSE